MEFTKTNFSTDTKGGGGGGRKDGVMAKKGGGEGERERLRHMKNNDTPCTAQLRSVSPLGTLPREPLRAFFLSVSPPQVGTAVHTGDIHNGDPLKTGA